MSKHTTTYQAQAWRDPLSNRINLAVVAETEEGRAFADGSDCGSRCLMYAAPVEEDEIGDTDPVYPIASLRQNEAEAVFEALREVLE